jgi:myo-inositol-1(or 4)-monophosphatase
MNRDDDVRRITEGLRAAAEAVAPFTPGAVEFETKDERDDPLTAADLAADRVLKDILPQEGEGWLSELVSGRVWVVDPIDGTREFVEGIPEWCISIGLLEEGIPVAGGIFNPATDEMVVGAVGSGVTYNGEPATVLDGPLDGATVLASRSETRRGEWKRFADAPFQVKPCGSVAYKMALVAAGKVDMTWTLVPKSEWDVAGGAALIAAAGGLVTLRDGTVPTFNQEKPLFPNFVAAGRERVAELVGDWLTEE